MKKEFKSGDKVFHIELEEYGIFIGYSKLNNYNAIVEFIDLNGNEYSEIVPLCFLKKEITTMEIEKIICPNCKKLHNKKHILGAIVVPYYGIELKIRCPKCSKIFICKIFKDEILTNKKHEEIKKRY